MNACRICGQKGLNCDCTDSDRKAYELEEETEEAEEKIQQLIQNIELLRAALDKLICDIGQAFDVLRETEGEEE